MALEDVIEQNDLAWSDEGDFIIDRGDIGTTLSSLTRIITQEIADRIKSSSGDWKLYRDRGAGLESFRGEVNNERTRRLIKLSVSKALTRNRFMEEDDFSVSVAPISHNSVAIRIDVDMTQFNSFPDDTFVFKAIYDTEGKGPFRVR